MLLRILCLHGMGVNSDVFRVQTAPFRDLLPSSYVFEFVDGDLNCDPSPGAAEFYNGPYRCWYNSPSREKVERAHKQVSATIRIHGPFDMVMGFSQGAALAASMILHHQIERPKEPPLFRAAVFICSPLPFSRSVEHGIDVRTYFGLEVTHPLSGARPTTVPDYLIPAPYFLQRDKPDDPGPNGNSNGNFKITATPTSPHPPSASLTTGFVRTLASEEAALEDKEPYYNMFHASVDSARIAIPTAHIYGHRDSWRYHSVELIALCNGPKVVFEHDGGHEVPRAASEEICDVIEEVVVKAGLLI